MQSHSKVKEARSSYLKIEARKKPKCSKYEDEGTEKVQSEEIR